MANYRRAWIAGGTYFFTVVTKDRDPWLTHPPALTRLREGFRKVRRKQPFDLQAIAILPDHLHAIWKLPDGDSDYSGRWRLIKHHVVVGSQEGWQWQPRYWEHLIRDEEDWQRHVDYIHYNPVKHGYAKSPFAWPWSSFRNAVRRGWYEENWGAFEPPGAPVETGE